jgi:hypothetical protein
MSSAPVLEIERSYARGSRGKSVRLIQEWLSLNGVHVVVDGDFGPATQAAVRTFQRSRKLGPDGIVDSSTFEALCAPMRRALTPVQPRRSLAGTFLAVARQHLKAHPREIGGQNMGPWVRLYMQGNEGAAYAWCAGFVCFVLAQACAATGRALPIEPSVSCDSLAASAIARKVFVGEREARARKPKRGALFLNRRTARDWTHVGLVTKFDAESMLTIEGNTNDEGSREGYEVCARRRGYASKDFVLIV